MLFGVQLKLEMLAKGVESGKNAVAVGTKDACFVGVGALIVTEAAVKDACASHCRRRERLEVSQSRCWCSGARGTEAARRCHVISIRRF
jgi:hypothetical protein